MTRWVLIIGAVLAWIFGAMILLAPGPFLAPIGIAVTDKIAAVAQAQGALLVGLGFINFLARGSTDPVALRAVLVGNLVVQLLSLGVAVRAVLLGIFPAQGAASIVIHVVLAALFVLALRRVRAGAGPAARGA